MKLSSEYRADAREALSGNWGTFALFTLVYMVGCTFLSFVCGLVPLLGNIASILLILPVSYAFYVTFVCLLRGEVKPISYLAGEFNGRVFSTMVLETVYTYLWTLLLIIPGIIKSYSYAMTPYIMKDNEELQNNAAIEESMKMMDGHKMDLFILDITFIGWYILGVLTCGIGLLWVIPYHYTARAAFYEDLKNE